MPSTTSSGSTPGRRTRSGSPLRRLDIEPVGILAHASETGTLDPLDLSVTLPPGRLESLELGPLSLTQLRQVVGRVVDQRLPTDPTADPPRPSAGNPLHALALARGLAQGRAASVPSMPASLHSAISQRLDALPSELGPVLDAAAAAGPVTVDRLGAVLTAVDEGSPCTTRITRAEQEGVLVGRRGPLRWHFTHPVIAAAVYGGVSRLTRRTLHARLAELEPHPDARARHLALSTTEPDHEAADPARRRGVAGRAAGRVRDRGRALRSRAPDHAQW